MYSVDWWSRRYEDYKNSVTVAQFSEWRTINREWGVKLNLATTH